MSEVTNSFVLPKYVLDEQSYIRGDILDERLTARQILDRNIEAIGAYIDIQNEGKVSVESLETLKLYSGFGGIGLGLMIKNPYNEDLFSDLNMESTRQKLIGLHERIKSCDKLNYHKIIDSLAKSEKTAYYTPKSIAGVMSYFVSDYLQRFQSKSNIGLNNSIRFLEPAVGMGTFYDALKNNKDFFNSDHSFSFVEMDFFSSEFSKLIYLNDSSKLFNSQSYNIRFEDFVNLPISFDKIDVNSRHDKFDLILSNIPFGDIRVEDKEYSGGGSVRSQSQKTVHGYYFMRGVDLLEKNGVLAYITSTSIADGKNYVSLRKELMMEAKLLSVSRLPNAVFNNTRVNSDVIVFQKREQRLENESQFSDFEKKFLTTQDFTFKISDKGKVKKYNFPINSVFLDDRGKLNDRVLGEATLGYMHKPILAITTYQKTFEVAQDLGQVMHNDLSLGRNKENEKEPLIVNSQELEDMNLYLSMDDLALIHEEFGAFYLPDRYLPDLSKDELFTLTLQDFLGYDGFKQEIYDMYLQDVNYVCCCEGLSLDDRISQLRDLGIRKPEKVLLTYRQNKQKQSIDNQRRAVKSEIMNAKASIKNRSKTLKVKVEKKRSDKIVSNKEEKTKEFYSDK